MRFLWFSCWSLFIVLSSNIFFQPSAFADERIFIETNKEIGFLLGGNLSTVEEMPTRGDLGWKPGIGGGLRIKDRVTRFFDIQAEVLYVQRGVSEEFEDVLGTGHSRQYTTFHYAQVPLLARFRLPITESINGHLDFGPSGSALLANNTRPTDTRESGGEELNFDQFDLGLVVGIGGSMVLEQRTFSLEVRYDRSLMSILASDESDDRAVHSAVSLRAWIRKEGDLCAHRIL